MKTIRRILAFALVLMLTMSLGVNAVAADAKYQLTRDFVSQVSGVEGLSCTIGDVVSDSTGNYELVKIDYQGDLSAYTSHITLLFAEDGSEAQLYMYNLINFSEEKLNEKFGSSAKNSMNAGDADGSLEERIRAAADEKLALLTSQYGVTNIDYAVVIDGQVITGNSRHFIIKDVSSLMTMAEQQLTNVSAVSEYGSIGAMIVLSAVVAVILGLIASSNVKRQRRKLGIMKGMGYTSKDLMKQIAIKTMPVTIVSVIIASFAAKYVYSTFWLMAFGVVGELNIPLTIIAGVVLVTFCYAVTYISAGKIKAISVTELMTE